MMCQNFCRNIQQEIKLSINKMLSRVTVMKSDLSTNSGHTESKILTFNGRMSEYIVATFESRNLLLLLKAVKKHLLDVRREPTIGHVKGEKQLELCTQDINFNKINQITLCVYLNELWKKLLRGYTQQLLTLVFIGIWK